MYRIAVEVVFLVCWAGAINLSLFFVDMRVAERIKDTCMRKLRHFKVLTVPGILTDIFISVWGLLVSAPHTLISDQKRKTAKQLMLMHSIWGQGSQALKAFFHLFSFWKTFHAFVSCKHDVSLFWTCNYTEILEAHSYSHTDFKSNQYDQSDT